jgi:Tfp pilus assembly protein PilO
MNSTTTRIGAIAGIAALFLAVIWFFALFQPESHHLKAAHADRAAADAKGQTLTAEIASLKALQKQGPQDRAALATLKQAVPDTPDLSDALGQLHNAATTSGVQLSSVSPTAPPTASAAGSSSASSSATGQQSSGPASISISMTGTGSYQQVISFMTLLDKMARTVVLDQVDVSNGNANGVTANLTARIFYAGSANS